ncbi:Uncharacterised protein [Acinetobacter baumannii]|nr:Uncharacterised protein [Acinetobacter baumannii]
MEKRLADLVVQIQNAQVLHRGGETQYRRGFRPYESIGTYFVYRKTVRYGKLIHPCYDQLNQCW